MHTYHWVPAGLLLAAALISAPAAHASLVNTYTFTQTGWFDIVYPSRTIGTAEPGVSLSGSFTGTVEPNGLIQLADLSAFTETLTTGSGNFSQAMDQLTLFSFNTIGGASSLDIAGSPVFEVNLCSGAAVSLSPSCNRAFSLPPGIFAAYEALGSPFLVSENLPQITLVSSRPTSPGVTTPEPSSLFLTGTLLVLLGIVRRRKLTSTTISSPTSATASSPTSFLPARACRPIS